MSEKILSTTLRPRTLSGLYGQDAMVKSIRAHAAKRLPDAWLFYGSSGCGKTTVAKILSIAFQCSHMKLWGDPCSDCGKKRDEFAIHEINASDDTGINEMREVVRLSRHKPTFGNKRVIVLNECHRLSKSSQDMLLDPVENPSDHLVWILVTTEPNKLIDTLRKRCVKYQLKGLGISAVEDFLKKMSVIAEITRPLEPLFEQAHLLQVNAPRDLLMALDKFATGCSASEAVSGIDESGIDSLRICRAVTSGKWLELKETMKVVTPEQSRLVRASVAGWLRGCLLRETSPRGQEKAAASLIELSTFPLDDGALLIWLWGTLWKICKRYGAQNPV